MNRRRGSCYFPRQVDDKPFSSDNVSCLQAIQKATRGTWLGVRSFSGYSSDAITVDLILNTMGWTAAGRVGQHYQLTDGHCARIALYNQIFTEKVNTYLYDTKRKKPRSICFQFQITGRVLCCELNYRLCTFYTCILPYVLKATSK